MSSEPTCNTVSQTSDIDQSTSTKKNSGMTPLAMGYEPGNFDVICARGKSVQQHRGNERFRRIIQMHLEEYATKLISKRQKSAIITTIVDTIRQYSPNGGFIRRIDGRWYEVGDHVAREKIGQGFRDALHGSYKSSTRNKLIQRKVRNGKSLRTVCPFDGHETTQILMSTSSQKFVAPTVLYPDGFHQLVRNQHTGCLVYQNEMNPTNNASQISPGYIARLEPVDVR